MKPLSWFKHMFVLLISPILIIMTSIPVLTQPPDKNTTSMKNITGQPYSGRKTAGFDYSLDLDKMKAYCKKKQCTINDYTSSVLGCALQEYFAGEEKRLIAAGEPPVPPPESVHVAVPFSFR